MRTVEILGSAAEMDDLCHSWIWKTTQPDALETWRDLRVHGRQAFMVQLCSACAPRELTHRYSKGHLPIEMLIIASKPGQLGNRLFLFAQFLACAIEYDIWIMNPSFAEYGASFVGTAEDSLCRFPTARLPVKLPQAGVNLPYRLCYFVARLLARTGVHCSVADVVSLDWNQGVCMEDPDFVEAMRSIRLLFLQGWLFRAPVAARKHATMIRGFFQLVPQLQHRVGTFLRQIRNRCEVLVGIHIRQGDYQQFEGGRYYYETEAFTNLMFHIQQLFPTKSVGFVVCSNVGQPDSLFSAFNFSFGRGPAVVDMYSLAGCDYIIGPPSTFSMWASFYGSVPLYMIKNKHRFPGLQDFEVVHC